MPDVKRPIIDSIREYIATCPYIDDRKINIDYLGDGMEYSIDPIGADPIYKRYTDGTCLKQFQFALTSKEAYDGDARTGIATADFASRLKSGRNRTTYMIFSQSWTGTMP